jgi:hypothetical protein
LNQMICEMNKEELRFFKIFLSRTVENDDRKDVMLFNLIRAAGENYDEEKIFKKLYPDGNKNAFYRLKNRLINDLSTSIFLQHYSENDDNSAMFLVSQANYYYSKSQYDLSLYFLSKAEQKAAKGNNPELLNHIYAEMIKLSHNNPDIDPETYIIKRKQLIEEIKKINQINDIIAVINYRLTNDGALANHNNSILSFLQHTINEFCNDNQLINSNFLKQKIYEVVPKILKDKKEYAALELYLLTTYLQFSEDNVFNQGNHEIKIQMLLNYIQVLYTNKKFDRSLNYCQKLYTTLEEFNGMLIEKYLFDYYNALISNLIQIDTNKAIETLERLKTNSQFLKLHAGKMFIYLNIAVIYFTKHEYDKSLESIYNLYMTEDYDKTDILLKFNATITELFIRYETKDFDYIKHLINQIEQEYVSLIEKEQYKKEKTLVDIFSLMISEQDLPENKLLQKKVRDYTGIPFTPLINGLETINYNNWLLKNFPF